MDENKDPMEMTDEEFSAYLSSLAEGDGMASPEPEESEEDETVSGEREIEPDAEREIEQPVEQKASEPTKPTPTPANVGGDDISRRLGYYAKRRFPDNEDAISALLDSFDEEAAADEGMSVEDFRKNRDEMQEFEQWKAERAKRQESESNVQRIVSEWESDSRKLSAFVPGFSLGEAMKNQQFKEMLLSGKGVFDAYVAMNPPEKKQASAPQLDEVGRSAASSALGTASRSIEGLPRKEFLAEIEKLRNRD